MSESEHKIVAADIYPHRTAEYNPLVTWVRGVVCSCGEMFTEKEEGGPNDAALIAFREHRRTPDTRSDQQVKE